MKFPIVNTLKTVIFSVKRITNKRVIKSIFCITSSDASLLSQMLTNIVHFSVKCITNSNKNNTRITVAMESYNNCIHTNLLPNERSVLNLQMFFDYSLENSNATCVLQNSLNTYR